MPMGTLHDPITGLAGRSAELARIGAAITDLQSLIVTGGRGCGRSRLLAAGAQLARDRGTRVIVADTSTTVMSMVRQLLLCVRHDLPDLPETIGLPARTLVGLTDGPLPEDPVRLVGQVFAAVTRRTPVLVVADDIDSTPATVAALLAGLPGTALLASAAGRTPPSMAGLSTLELAPLDAIASRRVLAGREQPPIGGRATIEILHRARGNPAALVELGRGGPLQASFAAVISDLPGRTRRLLLHLAASAAVAGEQDLITAADPSAEDLWQAAESAGLVTRVGDAVDFTHPLAAEAAYWNAAAHERIAAHRHLADNSACPPERRALHLAAVSARPDDDLATALATASGVFRGRDQFFEAAVAMQQAAERSPRPREAARRYAAAAIDAGTLGAAEWSAELYASVRDCTDEPDLITPAVSAAALALSRSGQQDEAYRLLAIAHRAGAADLLGPAVAIAVTSGRQEHRRGLSAILARTSPGTDPVLAAWARLIIDPGDSSARAVCDDLVIPPPGTVLTPAQRSRLASAGSMAAFQDRTRLAISFLKAAVASDDPSPSPAVVDVLPALVIAYLDAGRWGPVEHHTRTAQSLEMPVAGAHLDALRAHLYALRGNTSDAVDLARRTWSRLDVEQHRAVHVRLLHASGVAALAGGDHDDAYRHLRSMFARDGEPLHLLSGRGVADLAAAAVRSGHRDEIRPVLDCVRAGAGREPTARIRLLLHTAEAQLAEGDRADHHFRVAAFDPAGHGWPYERAMAWLRYGEWLRRARRPRDARGLLAVAADVFRQLGAGHAAASAARELVASGQDSRPMPTSHFDILTPQERQVAQLAAGGLSNREIAERLFISVRTVGAHLQSVYPKFGITRRHQIADRLATQ